MSLPFTCTSQGLSVTLAQGRLPGPSFAGCAGMVTLGCCRASRSVWKSVDNGALTINYSITSITCLTHSHTHNGASIQRLHIETTSADDLSRPTNSAHRPSPSTPAAGNRPSDDRTVNRQRPLERRRRHNLQQKSAQVCLQPSRTRSPR